MTYIKLQRLLGN